MWTKIYRWLFGEKKPSNVIFTNSADGNGMSWEQAKADAKNGWKVKDHNWPAGDYVTYYASNNCFLRWDDAEKASYLFCDDDAEMSIGMIWDRCGRAK